MFPLSIPAPLLTVDTVQSAVQRLNWMRLGEMLLPRKKVDEIKQQYQSDDDRLHAVVEYWVQGDGRDKEPSWRRIIHELDCANETSIADNIRHFADSVPGKSCDSSMHPHSRTVGELCFPLDSKPQTYHIIMYITTHMNVICRTYSLNSTL